MLLQHHPLVSGSGQTAAPGSTGTRENQIRLVTTGNVRHTLKFIFQLAYYVLSFETCEIGFLDFN